MLPRLLITAALLLCLPAPASAGPPPGSKQASKARKVRKTRKARKTHKAARRRPRRRRPAARCRDIFCTAEVVRLDGRDGDPNKLTQAQVEQVMRRARGPLEPCLVQARRRDPDAVSATIEVVVDRRGRVLASRVNGKRRSGLARCMHRKLRVIRFPKSGVPRTVAAFTIGIAR